MINKLKTCRCCLMEYEFASDLYEFTSEFSLDSENEDAEEFMKIGDCFSIITSISVPEESEEESRICSTCLTDLKFCFTFMKKCQNSHEVFVNPEPEYDETMQSFKVEPDIIEYVDEQFIADEEVDEYEEEIVQPTISNISITKAPPKYQKTIKIEPKSFKVISPVKKVKKEIVVNGPFDCKKCGAEHENKNELQEHMRHHTSFEKNFKCEHCPKEFKNRYQLTLHNRSHSGEKPYECHICNRAFSMSSNLQKHIDTHSTDKPYGCATCGQYFKTQRSLKFHTVCYHQPEIKVKCTICDKSFVNKSYLKMHMLYHTGQKNYTCTICRSKYYKSSHLKRHVQNVHMKLRLMKCEFCTSDFVRKETYRSHVTSHHKKDMTNEEYEAVLEKIKLFQPPPIDIEKYTLEKQYKNLGEKDDSAVTDEMEMIEEDSEVQIEEDNEEIYYEEQEDEEEDN